MKKNLINIDPYFLISTDDKIIPNSATLGGINETNNNKFHLETKYYFR